MWHRQKIFLMSGIGVVVGFSNFWTFPSLMTQYGGIVFLISYLLALICFAVPLMVLQVGIGKNIRKTPVQAIQHMGGKAGLSIWKWSGLLLVTAATLTVVIYSVVAGMGMAYAFKSAFSEFRGADIGKVVGLFADLQHDTQQMLQWLSLFMVMVYVISIRGMYRGLASAIQYFIPLMGVILVGLMLFSARLPTMESAVNVLFAHEISSLSWPGVLAAFKQAFFSLALGTGVFILLGSYMPSHGHITRVAVTVALVDTAVGVIAGLIIVPWLLMFELPLDQGFSLLFQSVPFALGNMPLGQIFGVMLFVLLTLAAWSSAIFLIEPLIAWIEERLRWPRWLAASIVLIFVWAAGAGLVLSLTDPDSWSLAGIPLFSLVQFIGSTLILPMAGGLLLVLCVYILPAERLATTLGMTTQKPIFRLGRVLLRYICVPAVLLVQGALIADLLTYSCQLEGPLQGSWCVTETALASDSEVEASVDTALVEDSPGASETDGVEAAPGSVLNADNDTADTGAGSDKTTGSPDKAAKKSEASIAPAEITAGTAVKNGAAAVAQESNAGEVTKTETSSTEQRETEVATDKP